MYAFFLHEITPDFNDFSVFRFLLKWQVASTLIIAEKVMRSEQTDKVIRKHCVNYKQWISRRLVPGTKIDLQTIINGMTWHG